MRHEKRLRRAEHGFVLLIVLWTVALLGLITTQLSARARGEAAVAVDARESANLEAAADGGVNAAIFRVLSREWDPDAVPRQGNFGPIRLITTIENEAGRINPNDCPAVLFRSFLRELGLSWARVDEVMTAMALWRSNSEAVLPQYQRAGLPYGPTNAPFQSVDEIGLVLGVTPDLLKRMKPHISLFHQGDVDARFADTLVAQAIAHAGAEGTPLKALNIHVDDLLIRIAVDARASDGRRSMRLAEVRFPAHPEQGAADYSILSWENE